jgi:hypothetical protein
MSRLRVRAYDVDGDAVLVTVPSPAGPRHLLIDGCDAGSDGTLPIARDVLRELGGQPLDVVVAAHPAQGLLHASRTLGADGLARRRTVQIARALQRGGVVDHGIPDVELRVRAPSPEPSLPPAPAGVDATAFRALWEVVRAGPPGGAGLPIDRADEQHGRLELGWRGWRLRLRFEETTGEGLETAPDGARFLDVHLDPDGPRRDLTI